jgi:hypothetical protein
MMKTWLNIMAKYIDQTQWLNIMTKHRLILMGKFNGLTYRLNLGYI